MCDGRAVDEPTTSRATDEYERRYMDADRAVAIARVRQRLGLRLALLALLLVAVVVNVQQLMFIVPRLWALRHVAPMAVALFALGCLPFWLAVLWYPVAEILGAVTRVVVTPTHVRVHQGLRATDVPLDAITSVAMERTARWFPEVPVRRSLARRDAVYQSFRTKDALRVEWLDEKGRSRRVWVYLDEAEALRHQIEALRSGHTGVRVDVEGEAAEVAEEVVLASVRRGSAS